jgi:hypothetical protein
MDVEFLDLKEAIKTLTNYRENLLKFLVHGESERILEADDTIGYMIKNLSKVQVTK